MELVPEVRRCCKILGSMEFKHACKLCDRKFANGKSMGGHMRSHFVKLPVQLNPSSPNPFELLNVPKTIATPPYANCVRGFLNLEYGYAHGSRSHFASSGSRFSAAMELGVRASTRKRSKRVHPQQGTVSTRLNKPQVPKNGQFSSPDELVTMKDAALCLMMLSNKKWPEHVPHTKVIVQCDSDNSSKDYDSFGTDDDDYNDDDYSDDSMNLKVFGRRCEICNKVFKSYQALGGHMRNHKRPLTTIPTLAVEKKEFPCNICLKIFSSGQALGGHKKVHLSTKKKSFENPLPNKDLPIFEAYSPYESDSELRFASVSTFENDEKNSDIDTDTYYNGAE